MIQNRVGKHKDTQRRDSVVSVWGVSS